MVRADFLESTDPASLLSESADHFTVTYLQMSPFLRMEVSCHLVDSEVLGLLELLQVLFSDLDVIGERLWNGQGVLAQRSHFFRGHRGVEVGVSQDSVRVDAHVIGMSFRYALLLRLITTYIEV